MRGNIGVLRCHIPAFVRDNVQFVNWLRSDGLVLSPDLQQGEFLELLANILFAQLSWELFGEFFQKIILKFFPGISWLTWWPLMTMLELADIQWVSLMGNVFQWKSHRDVLPKKNQPMSTCHPANWIAWNVHLTPNSFVPFTQQTTGTWRFPAVNCTSAKWTRWTVSCSTDARRETIWPANWSRAATLAGS